MSPSGRNDLGRENRAADLMDEAANAREAGRLRAAIRHQHEAIDMSRELAADFPEDPRHRQAIAYALFGLGAMLVENGQPDDSVTALDECERLYTALGAEGFLDAEPLVSDVLARRSYSLARAGRGASAVAEADAAVTAYESLPATHDNESGLACTSAVAAVVLLFSGDPDLAVGSADRAIRIWVSRRASPTEFAIEKDEVAYLLWAATVAATTHARYGRADVSIFASQLGLQFVAAITSDQRAAKALSGARRASALYDSLDPGQRDILARRHAGQLHTLVTDLELPDQPGPTLADVLRGAGEDALAGDVTSPAIECTITRPSERCAPELAPTYAERLATTALRLLGTNPHDGIRAGLEAHWLFAAASRRKHPRMRHELDTLGRPWAEVLLALSDAYETSGEPAMALDLASWAAGVAQQLMPYVMIDPDLGALGRRCFERHGHLLIAAGSRQEGEAALALGRTITDMSR